MYKKQNGNAKDVGNGSKLFCAGKTNGRNWVGVNIIRSMITYCRYNKKKSDRIIAVQFDLNLGLAIIIYYHIHGITPQARINMDEVMPEFTDIEKIINGEDLNGLVREKEIKG